MFNIEVKVVDGREVYFIAWRGSNEVHEEDFNEYHKALRYLCWEFIDRKIDIKECPNPNKLNVVYKLGNDVSVLIDKPSINTINEFMTEVMRHFEKYNDSMEYRKYAFKVKRIGTDEDNHVYLNVGEGYINGEFKYELDVTIHNSDGFDKYISTHDEILEVINEAVQLLVSDDIFIEYEDDNIVLVKMYFNRNTKNEVIKTSHRIFVYPDDVTTLIKEISQVYIGYMNELNKKVTFDFYL